MPSNDTNADELRRILLTFDIAHAETSIHAVVGKISKEEADKEFESEINQAKQAIQAWSDQRTAAARLDELYLFYASQAAINDPATTEMQELSQYIANRKAALKKEDQKHE